MDPTTTTYIGAAALLVAIWLVRSGLAAVIVSFLVAGFLTVAIEALVFLGLQIILPQLQETGVFASALEWWFVLPLAVGGIAGFNVWRDLH